MHAINTRGRVIRAALLALVTPLLEKNPVKALAADTALVFSMTRLIWLAFAIACLRQISAAGVAGWPEATRAAFGVDGRRRSDRVLVERPDLRASRRLRCHGSRQLDSRLGYRGESKRQPARARDPVAGR